MFMRGFRALICYITILILAFIACSAQAATPSDWDITHPEIIDPGYLFAQSAILIDGDTGATLFSKNADSRMYPASTTKIMTLLLALESGISLDTMVTIPKEAEAIPADATRVPVFGGEQMTFKDLLYGFMLESGNDGAIAIAIIVSGSMPAFVARMNDRALEIGCVNTHFSNPHGYHDQSHYSTAADLAKIAKVAMENQIFRDIVSTVDYTMAATARRDKIIARTRVELINPESNYYYDKCIGIKTGFHSMAGQCLVGAAMEGDQLFISVVLFSTRDYAERKWRDTRIMMEYGYTLYDSYNVQDLYKMADVELTSLQVNHAKADDPYGGKLSLILSQTTNDGYAFMALKGSTELTDYVDYFNGNCEITYTTDYLDCVERRETVKAGSLVGSFKFNAPTGEVISGMLIASRDVELEPVGTTLWEYLTENMPILKNFEDDTVIYIIIGALALIAFIIIAITVRNIRRNRRRRQFYKRRREIDRKRRRSEIDDYDRALNATRKPRKRR